MEILRFRYPRDVRIFVSIGHCRERGRAKRERVIDIELEREIERGSKRERERAKRERVIEIDFER